MSDLLLAAGALVLVFEGILPFVAPRLWRDTVLRIAQLADGQIRFYGLLAMGGGLLMLLIVL